MNRKYIDYIEQLLDFAEKNDIFNMTSWDFHDFSTEVLEALERQIPTKLIHKEKNLHCPNCDQWLWWDGAIPNERDNYCGICGQAIDWSEE